MGPYLLREEHVSLKSSWVMAPGPVPNCPRIRGYCKHVSAHTETLDWNSDSFSHGNHIPKSPPSPQTLE